MSCVMTCYDVIIHSHQYLSWRLPFQKVLKTDKQRWLWSCSAIRNGPRAKVAKYDLLNSKIIGKYTKDVLKI